MKNFETLSYMYPNAAFSMVNDDLSQVTWVTEGITTPTQAEVDAKYSEMQAAKAQEEINKQAAKATAEAKVLALGLTVEDIKALLQ